MPHLQEIIRPTWSADKWLNNAWLTLTDKEKTIIAKRMEDMFANGLPLQLKHDKILYTHLFSLLTQLEIVGLHLLLKPIEKFTGTAFESPLRQQLMDEIFHASVFAKITYELSGPYALPPTENKDVEKIIALVLSEPDYRTSLILISLIAEGLIEEIFLSIKDIAPKVVETILEDESRHMDEFELYRDIGLPDKAYLNERIGLFENELINLAFSQKKYVITFVNLIGMNGLIDLTHNIDKRQRETLARINIQPGESWQFFMKNIPLIIQHLFHDSNQDELVKQTTTRKILTSSWDDPNQPTEYALFSANVSPLKFFEKKYPPETLTCLVLQAVSKATATHPALKHYMSHHKIYNPKDSYVGLAVNLPGCDDHLGLIEFKNCHEMSIHDLSLHIQNDMKIMIYCYKKVQELQIEHPYFADIVDQLYLPKHQDVYQALNFARPAISISNIGQFGYDWACSPLLPNETVKYTLTKVERKQVWNTTTNAFEIQDILPLGISVDHRIFDANIPVPKIFQTAFDEMFNIMQASRPSDKTVFNTPANAFIKSCEKLLAADVTFGFKYLLFSSQVWKNYKTPSDHFKKHSFMDNIKEVIGFIKSPLTT